MDYQQLLKSAEYFEKLAKDWKDLPKGWTSKSRKEFFQHLADGSVTECIEKMDGKVDDPGAFGGALKDQTKGKTTWRGKEKK